MVIVLYLDWALLATLSPMFDNSIERNLERQIDNLVYQLYGLTEEEIKIVENQN